MKPVSPNMRLRIAPPGDYLLSRDATSYGYFLLEPNHWDPEGAAFSRTLDLGRDAGGAVHLVIRQPGGAGHVLVIEADAPLSPIARGEIRRQVGRMLRLDEPPETLAEFHRADPRWAASGRGRLMRSPTLFEDVIKTVTSCNVAWPSTVSMNRRLCEALGERSVFGRPAFPSPSRLARTRAGTLRSRCGVGYRDARIVELARLFTLPATRGGIDAGWFEDPGTPDGALHDALIQLPGIGPYAAANIMQLLGRYSRLPLDTEAIRHAKDVLGMRGGERELMRRLRTHFEPFGEHAFRSYWFELMTFYESRRGAAATWEKAEIARSFTAAKFNNERPGAVAAGPKSR